MDSRDPIRPRDHSPSEPLVSSASLSVAPPTYQLRRQSAPSIIRSRFQTLRRGGTSRPATDVDFRGPLGLTLLFEPSEPKIDFIFVHGLGGGSRKTWSYSEDPMSFWPREWLPSERGFRNVRTHSFGYDSDWGKNRKSSLTIHDFGQALLSDMANSTSLKRKHDTSIVLVGHSMGRLVIKKAYLLARTDPVYTGIASRIHSIYFLGTPHRGADAAETLSAIQSVNVPSGSKAYVAELVPGAGTLQVSAAAFPHPETWANPPGSFLIKTINDTFRHYHQDVKLWSFYEGCPTTAGVTSRIIVSKDSACLGLPGERNKYLQADHRHLCKFNSPGDTNYMSLVECFRTTIEEIQNDQQRDINTRRDGLPDQMKRILKLLGVESLALPAPTETTTIQSDGSCEWLTTHETFQSWLTSGFNQVENSERGTASRFLWLTGPPGSGKTVATAHVVRYLEGSNLDCASFSFKSSSKTSPTKLILSLALHMAQSSFQVREVLLEMLEEGDVTSGQDASGFWQRIFVSRIFKLRFLQPQYWVLDGLDECPTRTLSTLVYFFSTIDEKTPLQIFMSSRTNDSIERLLRNHNVEPDSIRAGEQGSLQDIARFLQARLAHNMPAAAVATTNTTSVPSGGDGDGTAGLVGEILAKSHGIFLWVSLIVPLLEATYTVEAMRDVLRRVPSEMNGLYSDMLRDVAASPTADLARCVLKWVVCAPRPPDADTLLEAVRLDVGQTIRSVDSLAPICRNLVVVDGSGDDGDNGGGGGGCRVVVRVMHQTVKEFLTSESSGRYIARPEAHAQMADLCLRQLNDRKFLPPLPSRRIVATSAAGSRLDLSPIEDYIFRFFSYHLSHASPTALCEEILNGLAEFSASNLTTWVEWTASRGSLAPFTQTIQNIRAYLAKYIHGRAPIEPEYRLVIAILGDLARVVSVFGPSLLDTPSSIHNLIPLLSPTNSALYQKFGKKLKQKVICSSNSEWDERLSCLVFSKRITSVACNDKFLAVSQVDGSVRLYNPDTLEPICVLKHGGVVRRLCFGNVSNSLASCCSKRVVMWGRRQEKLWQADIPSSPLSVHFSTDDSQLVLAFRDATLWSFGSNDGSLHETRSLPCDSSSDSDDTDDSSRGGGGGGERRVVPVLVRACPVLNLVAIVYRSSHLRVARLDTNEMVGVFEKAGYEDAERPPQILDVAFSPAPDVPVVAVSYQDGDIVTVDPWSLAAFPSAGSTRLHAAVLASSPDGRTLAAADNDGAISLFAFETLRLLCRISSPLDDRVASLVFASGSLRFFDVRDRSCNVWEPPVLIQKRTADDGSSSENDSAAAYLLPAVEVAYTPFLDGARAITCMTLAANGKFALCGREDGSVTVHNLVKGEQCTEFRFHASHVDVRFLEWNEKGKILVSADASGRYVGTLLSTHPTGAWSVKQQLFDQRANGSILQLLLHANGSFLLVSTDSGEEVTPLVAQPNETIETVPTQYSRGPSRWMLHPGDLTRLLLFERLELRIFRWESLLVPDSHADGITLSIQGMEVPQGLSNTWYPGKNETVFQIISSPESEDATILLLDLSQINSATNDAAVSLGLARLMSGVKAVLGTHRSSCYFLSRRGWVCSIGTKSLGGPDSYTRHFFLPPFWLTAGDVILQVASKQDAVFANGDDVVLCQGLLDFEHKVPLEARVH